MRLPYVAAHLVGTPFVKYTGLISDPASVDNFVAAPLNVVAVIVPVDGFAYIAVARFAVCAVVVDDDVS